MSARTMAGKPFLPKEHYWTDPSLRIPEQILGIGWAIYDSLATFLTLAMS